MARFRGTLLGNRGEASRLGTKASGLIVSANGWDIGGEITLGTDGLDQDVISFYLTKGSNGPSHYILLGSFMVMDGELKRVRDASI